MRGEASRGSCLAAHPTGSFEATDKVPYASTKAAKSIEEDIIPFKVIKRCFVLKSSQKAMLVSYFAHGGQGTVPKAIICTKCFFTDSKDKRKSKQYKSSQQIPSNHEI